MDTAYVDRTADRELPHVPASTSMVSTSAGLEYASPGIRFREPFDWGGAVRQLGFALGVGLFAFAVFSVWGERPWVDNGCAFAGFGAGLVALAVPWPGHIGRRRERA